MSIFNVVTRSDICREFNCHRDSIKRWIKDLMLGLHFIGDKDSQGD